jgi:uncharacterized protein (TIGR03086 family)
MTEADIFVLANRTLNGVVARIGDDQWDIPVPPGFHRAPTEQVPTLREIISYHAYDDAWVPDILAGRSMDEVGRDTFSGDLLSADPKASFAGLVDKACAAAMALDDLDKTVHLSFGDYPAREYLWQINGFRGLRSRDIARVIGVEPGLPEDLVQGLWDEISPHAEEWRAIGVFRAAVPVPEDAPLLDRLLGLTGRDPAGF